MDNYMKKFNTFKLSYIYDFNISDGGLGDCIKFFMFLVKKSINDNASVFYLVNNIPIERYLLLKYKNMYINRSDINKLNYKIFKPYDFYNEWDTEEKKKIAIEKINIPFSNIFEFSRDIINHSNQILNIDHYNSIHVRLGDKFLETDINSVVCKNDTRNYNQTLIDKYIINNKHKNIILFSDNNAYKQMMKKKFNNLIINNVVIGHTSLTNTNETQIVDTISELFILSNSKEILCNNSGFSVVASKFFEIPLFYV